MKRAGGKSRRIAGGALATAAIALVSVLAPAAPAGASTAGNATTASASTVTDAAVVGASDRTALAGTCPFSNTLCLFEDPGYNGARFTVMALNPTVGACVDLVSHGWEARANSAINTNPKPATLYTNVNCTGTSYTISGSPPSFTFAAKSVFVY